MIQGGDTDAGRIRTRVALLVGKADGGTEEGGGVGMITRVIAGIIGAVATAIVIYTCMDGHAVPWPVVAIYWILVTVYWKIRATDRSGNDKRKD